MWRAGSWHCDGCDFLNNWGDVKCRRCRLREGRIFSETRSRRCSGGKTMFDKDKEFEYSSNNLATEFSVGKIRNVQLPPSFLNPAEDPLAAFEAAMQKLDSKKAHKGSHDEKTPPGKKDCVPNSYIRSENIMKRKVQGQRMEKNMRKVQTKLANLASTLRILKANQVRQNKELKKAKLSISEMEELIQLRQRVKILEAENAKCIRDHGTQEVKEPRLIVKKCHEEQFYKKEELRNDQHSSSNFKVKQESKELSGDWIKREGFETMNIWDEIKSEDKGTEYFEC